MFDLGSVIATLEANTKGFQEGIENAQDKLSGLGSGLGKIGGILKGFGVAATVAGGIAAAGILVTSEAAKESEQAMAKFEALMSNTFGKTPKLFKEARTAALDLANSFVRLGFDDEETAIAMAKSLKVTKDVTQSRKELALAADFARLQDIGIGDAQKILQMAYMGNARVLKQYGIELQDNATKAQIFAKIQEIAGGQAEAFAGTYAGSVARFNIEFSNLKETIGAAFLPILTQAFQMVSQFINNLNSADFSWFIGAVEQIPPAIQNFYNMAIFYIQSLMTWFNTNFMPFIMLLVGFVVQNWDSIMLATQVMTDIITSIFTIFIAIATGLITSFLTWAQQFWKENGENIVKGLQGTWNLIVGIFQFATGVISVILAVFMGLLTGKWDEAWQKILKGTIQAFNGIKNILNGAVQFIMGWGGTILNELVKPFQDAWNRISDFVNKIKDALDFTKRNSPSILDIVKKGVGLVNGAMEDLTFGSVVPQAAALSVSNAGGATKINNVTVDLSGAFVGSEFGAKRIGETIGDSIIEKLQMSVRF